MDENAEAEPQCVPACDWWRGSSTPPYWLLTHGWNGADWLLARARLQCVRIPQVFPVPTDWSTDSAPKILCGQFSYRLAGDMICWPTQVVYGFCERAQPTRGGGVLLCGAHLSEVLFLLLP